MERTKLVVGNWKMNATHLEAIQMVQKLSYRLNPEVHERVEVVVAPPFTALRSVQTVIESDRLLLGLGAQNTHLGGVGRRTPGEISPIMLAKLGVRHVIVGHSERRAYFGETDLTVNKKVRAVLSHGMAPILCVGESLDEREEGRTEDVVVAQVRAGFGGLTRDELARIAVAYEPVWAIGTGRHADPDDAGAVAETIRTVVAETGGQEAAEGIRILYGGSVDAGNMRAFMAKRHIDGALVGGASLDPDGFAAVIRYWI